MTLACLDPRDHGWIIDLTVIVRDSSCAMRSCLFFGKSASGDKLLKQAVLVSELKAGQRHHFLPHGIPVGIAKYKARV